MIWFIVSVAAAVLVVLLIRTMRQYERESAIAALDRISELTEITMTLEKRIQNLEAIVTAVDAEATESGATPEADAPGAVRSPRNRT